MTSKHAQLAEFLAREQSLAAMVPADTLFGMLTRSYDLPADWSALARKSDGKLLVVSPGGVIKADDVEDVLFVRAATFSVETSTDNVPSRDAFLFDCDTRILLSIPAERTDLASFRERVLGSYTLATTDNIRRYFEQDLRDALHRACAEMDAASLVAGDATERLEHVVTEALRGPCFAAGLELAGNVSVSLTCDSYDSVRKAGDHAARKQRAHEAEEQLRQALRDAQSRHMDHLKGLVDRARELASHSPDVGLQEIIKSFPAADRGQMYAALLAAPAQGKKDGLIAVATADHVLLYDAWQGDEPIRTIPLQGGPGQLRSIQTVSTPNASSRADSQTKHATLLIGAARGAYVLPADGTQDAQAYTLSDAPLVRGGCNAVAMSNRCLLATHSELGIIRWDPDEPGAGQRLFQNLTANADAVRGACLHEGMAYASIGNTIVSWPESETPDRPERTWKLSRSIPPMPITAVCPTRDGMYAGISTGQVLYWPSGNFDKPEEIHRGYERPVETVQLLENHGVTQLLIADLTSRLSVKVIGDAYALHYEAGGQTLRRAHADPFQIVAMNDLRDRLICWKPGEGERPARTIRVAARLSEHVQDFCLV